ncbi:hypothetical protein A3A75_00955 [Candidatus Woesebacteria bacterium RIFCSPLOWO2_01_FULL_39_10]|uniref:N-acetyltransferase domain-containing protein n=1 Tax=Candidatus Woesebacteria bacterium RIFCSPLOWO2_01_FULL_39_10 TaxID=1802516 RepID=A0A1F8B8M0_9BACT|nr:MAG: hypothetical protein A3A75_00955 [Candidatus Woesebacteria bacterium RIFCSPLOWO2_01_FULL_39_10]
MNTPHVVEWYGKKHFTLDEVKQKYLPRINADSQLSAYVDKDASAGLDLFIGDPTYLGLGLGSKILKEFLEQVVFQEEGITTCVVDPSPNNTRMIRVNEKVGFKYLTTTTGSEPKYLMIKQKEDT